MTLGGGVLNCWAKKQKSVALSSWESELVAAIASGTRSLGIQSELMDLGYSCSATVATDSRSVIAHSKRRGRSVASKHVGLRGLWLQEAPVDGKLELEKVDTAMNPADVCTKALLGKRIRELCRLARVYVCDSEETIGDDPNEWYLRRLDELCRCEKFEQSCDAVVVCLCANQFCVQPLQFVTDSCDCIETVGTHPSYFINLVAEQMEAVQAELVRSGERSSANGVQRTSRSLCTDHYGHVECRPTARSETETQGGWETLAATVRRKPA